MHDILLLASGVNYKAVSNNRRWKQLVQTQASFKRRFLNQRLFVKLEHGK